MKLTCNLCKLMSDRTYPPFKSGFHVCDSCREGNSDWTRQMKLANGDHVDPLYKDEWMVFVGQEVVKHEFEIDTIKSEMDYMRERIEGLITITNYLMDWEKRCRERL